MVAKKTTTSAAPSPELQKTYKRWADLLQRTRRDKRLSIRKVAQMSNLPDSTIRLLEHPKEDKLPDANTLGLYKLYASALDLELDTSMAEKKAAKAKPAKTNEADTPIFSFKRAPKKRSMIVFSHIWTGALVSLALIAVAGYALWQGSELFRTPVLVVEYPASEFVKVQEPNVIVRGRAEPDSSVLINGDPVPVSHDGGHFSEAVYLQPGYNYINVEAVNNFSTQSLQTFTVVYDLDSSVAAATLETD